MENYFTGDELEPVKESVAGLVDFLADLLYEEGKIDCMSQFVSLSIPFPNSSLFPLSILSLILNIQFHTVCFLFSSMTTYRDDFQLSNLCCIYSLSSMKSLNFKEFRCHYCFKVNTRMKVSTSG